MKKRWPRASWVRSGRHGECPSCHGPVDEHQVCKFCGRVKVWRPGGNAA